MKLLNTQFMMLLLLGTVQVFGQQTVSTSGGTIVEKGASFAYTIGQPAYIAFSGTNGSVGEGVQNSIVISVVNEITGIGDNFSEVKLTTYPNPTSENLIIEIENFTRQMQATLFDQRGINLKTISIDSAHSTLDMTDLNTSIYFLRVAGENGYLKTFRIIKN